MTRLNPSDSAEYRLIGIITRPVAHNTTPRTFVFNTTGDEITGTSFDHRHDEEDSDFAVNGTLTLSDSEIAFDETPNVAGESFLQATAIFNPLTGIISGTWADSENPTGEYGQVIGVGCRLN